MVSGILFVVTALSLIAPSVEAIKQKELVSLMRDFLGHVPPIAIPDVEFAKLNIYANAANISIHDVNLSDLSLSIPDSKHMLFTLQGMTGEINLHLLAGLTGFIPVRQDDDIKGTLADMKLAVTFEVADGDAKMSHIDVSIGTLNLDFGDDMIAGYMAKMFLPVLKLSLEDVLPRVILLFKDVLDLDHIAQLFLTLLPMAVLPEITLTEMGYDMKVTNVKLDSVSASSQTFALSGNQMIFNIVNMKAAGNLKYKIGKVGSESATGVATMDLNNANLQVVAEVNDLGDQLEIKYVSAFNTIESLVLGTDSTNPMAQWLVSAMPPLVKHLLQDGFAFLVNGILSL